MLLVVVFAAIGRASHHEHVDGGGIATTAWPFLAGLAVGWIVALGWRRPTAVRTGVIVWALTVAVGMLLRVVSVQGVQTAFVVVAAIVLGVFLVGWRALVMLVRRNPVR